MLFASPSKPPAMLRSIAIYNVLSLVFWAVILVVAIKYVLIVMRADNDGEGGTMALLSLVLPKSGKMRRALLIVGLGGASLFFGDAMITPAISVLSAVEGVEIVTPLLKPYVVPLAAAILVGLFMIQSRGSASVGRFFGPIMALWFVLLGAAGGWNLLRYPQILAALNPSYAISFSLTRMAGSPSPSSVRSSWPLPAARLSTRIWDTLAARRSGSIGLSS